MKYTVYCVACDWRSQARTKRLAKKEVSHHRRTAPCDMFLEIATNTRIELTSEMQGLEWIDPIGVR